MDITTKEIDARIKELHAETDARIKELQMQRELVAMMEQSKLSPNLLAAGVFKNSIFVAEYSTQECIILWLQYSMAKEAMDILEPNMHNGSVYLEQKNVLITETEHWLKFTFTSNSYAVGFVNKFGLNISLHRLQEQIVNTQAATETMLKLEKDLNNGKYTKRDGGLPATESEPEEETTVS